MSTALDIIIARGFGSPVQGAMDSFNNQRQANQSNKLSGILQQNAVQDQQWQGEDRALEEQARQKAAQRAQEQESLLAMIPEIDARLRANPDDQEARAAAVEIHSRLNPEKSVEGIGGLLYPKQSGPQSALGKLGADLAAGRISQADYDAAAKKATYIAPPSGPTVIQPSYSLVPVQNPDGTVAQTMVNTKDPSDRSVVGNAPAKQNTKTSDAQTSQRTFDAFTKAIGNVEASFAKTDTGPIVGLLPAYTENQQIAEGAVAAMAPILKQLFRSAGEGVFTDKDQALLLDMAPKRTDRPGAAAAKIQAIKDIVAAKLGATTPVQPGETVENAKKYTTASGATVEILD